MGILTNTLWWFTSETTVLTYRTHIALIICNLWFIHCHLRVFTYTLGWFGCKTLVSSSVLTYSTDIALIILDLWFIHSHLRVFTHTLRRLRCKTLITSSVLTYSTNITLIICNLWFIHCHLRIFTHTLWWLRSKTLITSTFIRIPPHKIPSTLLCLWSNLTWIVIDLLLHSHLWKFTYTLWRFRSKRSILTLVLTIIHLLLHSHLGIFAYILWWSIPIVASSR